jgi:predicted dehydrogenase
MANPRAAVIGAGRLGTLHAEKYRALEGIDLQYVVDVDHARADAVAVHTGAAACYDHHELRDKIDIASVASPGVTHHAIAADLLRWGIDVLLEKPMAATLDEARELGAIAAAHQRILQIGHLERFNPAIERLGAMLHAPRFIECHRLAPFTERGTDVDVVLDLMVHDLDVILSLVPAAVVKVEAVGVAVLTDQIDIANARIRFADGLIANLNSSRVAARRERKIRFFQPDTYLSVDYEARTIQVYRKSPPPAGSSFPLISGEMIDLGEGDPLMDEVRAFVTSVRTRGAPRVSADDGLRVMELSELIRAAIAEENASLNL